MNRNQIDLKETILKSYDALVDLEANYIKELMIVTNFGLITGNIYIEDSQETNDLKGDLRKTTDCHELTDDLMPDFIFNFEENLAGRDFISVRNATISPYSGKEKFKLKNMLIFTHQIVGFSYNLRKLD